MKVVVEKEKIFFIPTNTLAWLHFFWKCGVRQCGLGKVSTDHKKNLSHFYISKKFWKPCQTFGRLVLAVWSRADWLVFFKVSRTFLKYENGWNFFYELLRSILTYTELSHIFEKKVITLFLRVQNQFPPGYFFAFILETYILPPILREMQMYTI